MAGGEGTQEASTFGKWRSIKGILDDGVKEGIFSMPDTDITALVLHHALKGLEVPYIRGIMGDNISQRIKRRDNVMNLIFNGIKIK